MSNLNSSKTLSLVDSTLSSLMKKSIIVVDSANLSEIDLYQPVDATTNPSSVLAAISLKNKNIESLLTKAEIKKIYQSCLSQSEAIELIYDYLLITLAKKILSKVKGFVSIEVDAEFAYDNKNTIKRAQRLIEIAQQKGLDEKRILIKIASTWEGILAARELENQKIHCNLTLIFNYYQAIACAHANAHTISPFVGRILDWFKNKYSDEDFSQPFTEPGVHLVRAIYQSYKKKGIKTIVMGASFRNSGEIIALAGCDKLTIHPKFLNELAKIKGSVENNIDQPTHLHFEDVEITEAEFKKQLNKDVMAYELLRAGVEGFAKDTQTLKKMIQSSIIA